MVRVVWSTLKALVEHHHNRASFEIHHAEVMVAALENYKSEFEPSQDPKSTSPFPVRMFLLLWLSQTDCCIKVSVPGFRGQCVKLLHEANGIVLANVQVPTTNRETGKLTWPVHEFQFGQLAIGLPQPAKLAIEVSPAAPAGVIEKAKDPSAHIIDHYREVLVRISASLYAQV